MSGEPACPATQSRGVLLKGIGSAAWAVVLGVASGFACVSVRVLMRWLQWLFTQHAGPLPMAAASLAAARRFGTPVLGALIASATMWAAQRWSRGGAFEEYVEAVRFRDGTIPFASTLWRTLSSMFSVATGAAIGREGAMIQFAAAVTSWIGRHSKIQTPSLARQVSYGAAAAIAAAYAAPCAGVLFAYEVVLGEWSWSDGVPLAFASIAGWFVSRYLLGGAGHIFAVHALVVSRSDIGWGVLLAVLAGCLAPMYHWLLGSLRFARRWPLALLWGGIAVGLLSLEEPAVWGNGDVGLTRILAGCCSPAATLALLVARLLATTICVGTGTVGGVFTPTLFAGAAIGFIAGQLLGTPGTVLFAVIGMAVFLAAVTHAPLMATAMAVELTGAWHLAPLLLLYNLLAWETARRLSSHSLYAIATPAPLEPENAAA